MSTVNFKVFNDFQVMDILPEILDHIASYTDAESHLACTYVCRDWRKIFERHLRRTVNPCLSPYKQFFACSGSEGDRRHHIAALLRRHKEHIRHLTVTDNAVLLAALDSNLTDLLSLTMMPEPNTLGTFSDEFSKSLIGDNPSTSDSGSNRWKIAVQRQAFASGYRRGEAGCTRASWLLVLENPGLQHLVFEWNWNILGFNARWNKHKCYHPLPPSKDFLDRVFSGLASVRHVRIGFFIDTYLFSNLSTLLPNVTSFVYTGQVYFNPVTIQLVPRPELKRLVFNGGIDIRQFRSLVVAFPNLRHLSILRFKDNEGNYSDDDVDAKATGVNMETPMDVLEYPSLESLVFADSHGSYGNNHGYITKLLASRIRFPRIREMKSYVDIVGPSVVRQALRMLPALEVLHCWSPVSEIASVVEENEEVAAIHPIRVLNLHSSESHMPGLHTTITLMPFLVKLCIYKCAIDRRTLSSIVKNCRSLERFYFNLQESDGREMVDLLVGGATSLKSCEGNGHVVLAEDLIESAEWSCMGLEKLDVEVFGVPKQTREHEKVLEKLWTLNLSWFIATTNGATAFAELRYVELEQALEKLQQVGYELTPDEAKALERRRVSHTIQRKVYGRLGCLTQLQQISFISEFDHTTERQERFDGLEFNLMCDLGGQASLEHVKGICFSQPKPAINKADYE
ncbi:hypothetical protein BGX30_007679 [Mortierella sp. GBA39]|nr:hypothetical protein BGX30_007679 [Mortierella sp. GBA39]